MSSDEGAKELSALSMLNVKRMGCVGERKKDLIEAIRGSTKHVGPFLVRGKA